MWQTVILALFCVSSVDFVDRLGHILSSNINFTFKFFIFYVGYHTWRSVMETLWDSTVGRRGKRGEEWGDVMGE